MKQKYFLDIRFVGIHGIEVPSIIVEPIDDDSEDKKILIPLFQPELDRMIDTLIELRDYEKEEKDILA